MARNEDNGPDHDDDQHVHGEQPNSPSDASSFPA
jgi:hypothetical protein